MHSHAVQSDNMAKYWTSTCGKVPLASFPVIAKPGSQLAATACI